MIGFTIIHKNKQYFMETFVENILIGVRQWANSQLEEITTVVASHINELFDRVEVTEGKLDDVDLSTRTTLAETVSNEIIEALWKGDIKFEDLMTITGSADITPIDSQTNKEHFLDIFYPNPEEIFVDLGLSVKWHAVNLGAHAITDYGDFYAWGETETKDNYSWDNYEHANGAYNKLIKYCPTDKTNYWDGDGDPDNKLLLDLEDDVVNVELGGNYRMPTKAELEELFALPNKWISLNDENDNPVNGRVFCKKNTPGVVASNIKPDDLYFYDSEQDFGMLLSEYLSVDELKYISSVSDFNKKITDVFNLEEGYEGTADVTTMLFKDKEHTQLAIAGTDYTFGQFPDFDRSTMLFIPAAGYFYGSTHYGAGSYCGLWSSSLNSADPNFAWDLFFYSDDIYLNYYGRDYGFSVRCVSAD